MGNGTVEWFCVEGCGDAAACKHRNSDSSCVYEYKASSVKPEYNWKGIGSPPRRWTALDGTIVYRTYSDYCD